MTQQLWPAVEATLASLDRKPEDAAARKLLERYARIIDGLPDKAPRGSQDQAWALRWLGPLLLDVLRELQATPAARAQPGKQQPPANPAEDQLASLRASKASRRPRQQL